MEIFGDKEYVRYLDCGNAFMDAFIYVKTY
jgi:hypothetical protein